MSKLKVLLLIFSLSSLYFVHCVNHDGIKQFSWDLFKEMALVNDNVIMNGFGPQLLLLEVQLGAKGITKDEINTIAKSSSHKELLKYNENIKKIEKLNDFKTRIATFVSLKPKLHDTFLNEMFERSVEFRTTDFSKVNQTNTLLKRFYNYINYNNKDNYPESTKMIMMSSSSLDFQMDCHKSEMKKFWFNNIPQTVEMIKIYDSIKGGSIKNDKGTVIADWAELPKKYMKDSDISIVFVKPFKKLSVNDVLSQIKNLNFRNLEKTYSFLEFPLLFTADVHVLNDHLKNMGISSMFSEKTANFTGITGPTDENQLYVNDFKQTAAITMDCKQIEQPALTDEENGFEIKDPFIYIVLQAKTEIPLLIGKLSDPVNAKPDSTKRSTCKIPSVENGKVIDSYYDEDEEELIERADVPIDITVVKVKCDPGYDMKSEDRERTIDCKSWGWNVPFPNCTKMCQVNDLLSHSTVAICKINSVKYRCPRSVEPGTKVSIECKPRYKLELIVQTDFECKKSGEWDGPTHNKCEADCGQVVKNSLALTYHGIDAKPHEIPWNVGIYRDDDQVCGGTIISELIVLSAAHCFKAELVKGISEVIKSKFKVVAGKYYRDINADEVGTTQTFNIIDVKIPEKYMGLAGSYQNDIAILTLDNMIVYEDHIAPACLNWNAQYSTEKDLPAEYTIGLVAGFGQTEDGKLSTHLKKLELPYVGFPTCKAMARDSFIPFLLGDKFCAGFSNNTGGVCKGDSGSGLAFKDIGTKKYHIFGIVSNTQGLNMTHCDPHMYSLFTNVMDHINMIKEQFIISMETLQDSIKNPKKIDSVL